MFDLCAFLSKHSTIVKETSKEIFLGECPWCGLPGSHDSTISAARNKQKFYCFRCGKGGSWAYLVSKLARIPYEEAKKRIDGGLDLTVRQTEQKEEIKPVIMPPRYSWTNNSQNYLLDRGLSWNTINHFELYYCANGKYQRRIIIPVTSGGKVVTFQARAIDKDVELRYISPYGFPKNTIWFNLDSYQAGKEVIIVEGPFDVMKLHEYGRFAICPLGKSISDEQINLLTNLSIRDIVLFQDKDTLTRLGNIVKTLNRTFDVEIIPSILTDDPGDLSSKEQTQEVVRDRHHTVAELDWSRVTTWRKGILRSDPLL